MDLPGMHGVEVARQIWAHAPDTKIIFWAQFADETCMRQTFRLILPETVYGYLLNSASADQSVHTVSRAPSARVGGWRSASGGSYAACG